MPVSLHTHSWYSLLEGTASPDLLLERAQACGYTALALTDTNNLYGAVPFTEAAFRHGVRPILGARLEQMDWRCVALVADQAGYRSLCRVLSRLHLGVAGEGAALPEQLCANAEGLHVLVEDVELAERLREAFGSRLWLEVVRPARSAQRERELLDCGRRLGLRVVASTAAHCAVAAEYPAFRLATAVRRGTLLERLPTVLGVGPSQHLVSPQILRQRFRDLPEAVYHTELLAEQLRSDVLPRDLVLPRPRVPRALDEVRYLHLLCERGLRRRELNDSLAAGDRLREELAAIEAADLAGYFLVVRDVARYARGRGHSMALRGSAGNSLVCYLLEITDVDPLRFGLPLERFLHPGRVDLPDIDLDFDWKVRDDVLDRVVRRYGQEHTARICTHLFLQPRSAFREAAKAHGLSGEQISRLLETTGSRQKSEASDEGWEPAAKGPTGPGAQFDPFRLPTASCQVPAGFPLEAERWPRILADARVLLGRPHHLSIHPGGVVLTPRPIEEYVPLQWAPKGVVITQFEKDAIEHVGLVKIDLLGNRALATVDEARRASASARLPLPHPDRDPATVALLQRGDTLGVNQLESPAMRHLLAQMQPRCLDDVIQSLALIRPGAASVGMKECFIRRRRGLEPVRHLHSSLEPILKQTQGLMLYEDDALRVIQALTGLEAPDADRFRKRVTKHRTEAEALALSREFLTACARRGVPGTVAGEVWVQLAKFNQYSFCKSHAVSYGLIAWEAAGLKAHRPLAFWVGALNNNQGMYPRRVYVEAVKRAGFRVRLPCVNRSAAGFTIEEGELRTGLEAIATLDEALEQTLLTDRERRGPYRDLDDLCIRLQPGPETLAALIRCGALDFTGLPRPALFLEAELRDREQGKRKNENGRECSLLPFSFCHFPWENWSPGDYSPGRQLRDEWELLGFVAGPPLLALFRDRLPGSLATSCELPGLVGRAVQVAGLVATSRRTETANGRAMQFVTLEDEWGLVEVTLFPGTCPPVAYLGLGPYLVRGVVEEQYGVVTVTAHRFELAAGIE